MYGTGILLTSEGVYDALIHNHQTYRVPSTGEVKSIINPKTGKVRINSKYASAAATNSKIVQGLGYFGNGLTVGVASYNIVTDMQNGQPVSGWDIADGSVGLVGIGGGAAASAGIISNPVGWGIGAGVGLYGWSRMWFDLGAKYGPSKWYGTNDSKWFE